MKPNFLIRTMIIFLFAFNSAKSQVITTPSSAFQQVILDGSYHLYFETKMIHGKTNTTLVHNFPGISHIKIKFNYLTKSGEKLDYLLELKGHENQPILMNGLLPTQLRSLTIDDFNIRYNLYGEQYCLTYTANQPYLKLTKNGVLFDYANHTRMIQTTLYRMLPDSRLANENEIDTSATFAARESK